MSVKFPDDILPVVEKPSRYLGSEINAVRKSGDNVNLRMALAFPDTYEIGTSHFGIQILYHLLNREAHICAERVFAPGLDMVRELKASGKSLFALESRRPLHQFDIVGFSLLYELNYTNVLMMLDLAGIPFYAEERDERHPFVIAGGPCTVNPEPMAPFFDAMVIGDGERVVLEMAEAWSGWKSAGSSDKTELLKQWAGIEGVYVPRFFAARYDEAGYQRTEPLHPDYTSVKRRVEPDLDAAFFPNAPVVPFGRPVHDRLRLEIARGCTRGCRFCQAGMIYRPVRERSTERLLDLAKACLTATGYEEISLLSLSTGDYSCLTPLMRELMERNQQRRIAVSIPSFRAGTLSPQMMELIKSIRKTGFTIAPEAGSERLRAVINKNITEAEIVETVSKAFELGWQNIKLYFMIGLPTETDADIDSIVELVHKLRKLRRAGKRGGNIHVSVATFIPKAHVPFQWAAQETLARAKQKIETLKNRLSVKGVEFKWQKPETSLLEGLWARGDRRLASLLVAAYQRGCRFDGWSDAFDWQAWQAAFADTGIAPEDYTSREIHADASLPWDHIDTGVSRAFLRQEYEAALREAATIDCREGECQGCGVCDFERIMPRLAGSEAPETAETVDAGKTSLSEPAGDSRRVKVIYAKQGTARYFGHLELIHIIIRALYRAGICPAFTEGFHPKPKIAFDDALPVGLESMEEAFYMTVAEGPGCEDIKTALNRELPEGLQVSECCLVPDKAGPMRAETTAYQAWLQAGGSFEQEAIARFWAASSFPVMRKTKKGADKEIDLKAIVVEINRLSSDCVRFRLRNIPGGSLRPHEVLRQIFSMPERALRLARVIKLPTQEAAPGVEQQTAAANVSDQCRI